LLSKVIGQKFIVSKAFAEKLDFTNWQIEDLGAIDLKGKKESVELVALKL